jgi:uncharacterized protein (UPF0261 family)
VTRTVLLIGTLDTKGVEIGYVRDRIRDAGVETLVLDSGIRGRPLLEADIPRDAVAEAGGHKLADLQNAGTRGAAVERMLPGCAAMTRQLWREGRIDGALCLGGAEGSVLGSAAMQELPLGVPKLIVTPIASGRRIFGPLIGIRDIMVMHSVVDILGINEISRPIYDNAAAAMVGMVQGYHTLQGREWEGGEQLRDDAPPNMVGITMLGNTTTAVMALVKKLEAAGYTPVIFHGTGAGGPAMEELIEQGVLGAVIDYTPNELAAEIAGGYHVPSRPRLQAAARIGIPQLVVASCLDFIALGARSTIPQDLQRRKAHYHNPQFTLLRIPGEEMERIGRLMAERLSSATGPTTLVCPRGGMSIANVPGGDLWDPEADERFYSALFEGLGHNVVRFDLPGHVNDAATGEAVADIFLNLVATAGTPGVHAAPSPRG